MAIDKTKARNIATRFLAVFTDVTASTPGTKQFDWEDLLENPMVPDKNWLRNLLIIIARNVAADGSLTVSPRTWNAHIDELDHGAGTKIESINDYACFLQAEL